MFTFLLKYNQIGCACGVWWMCTVYLVDVYRIFGGCVPYIWWMCTVYLVDVYRIFGGCVPHIWWMCTVYLVDVYLYLVHTVLDMKSCKN